MKKITMAAVKSALKKIKAPLFDGELNLTLVGIRSKDTDSNAFNDLLCVLYEKDGKPVMAKFNITTDPGTYYRENMLNVDGTAILKTGHYPACWRIGAHKGKYLALVQRGDMTVYRDNDGDAELDINDGVKTASGIFGINLHKASMNGHSLQVDKWSAGCQVMASAADFDELMTLVHESAKEYGMSFSYTLLDESEISNK